MVRKLTKNTWKMAIKLENKKNLENHRIGPGIW
jgi:hypothetical protein